MALSPAIRSLIEESQIGARADEQDDDDFEVASPEELQQMIADGHLTQAELDKAYDDYVRERRAA